MQQTSIAISLTPWRVTRVLVLILLVLIALAGVRLFLFYGLDMDLGYGAISKVDLDWENNLPTYFSTTILLLCSLLLTLIYLHQRENRGREAPRWGLLALIFLFMSIDEASSLHELLITPLRERFDLSGFLYFSWVIVAVPLLILLGALYLRFLVRLPAGTRGLFILAACLYIGGALGLEFFGGYSYAAAGEDETLQYELTAHTEEILEMTGIIIFIHALLGLIARSAPRIELIVEEGQTF
jgi:hypothetical protein